MEEWRYETEPDLEKSFVNRLKDFPRRPDMLVYGTRMISAAAIRAWLRLYHRLEISGRENLPAAGSYVLIANHASHLDILCLLSGLPLGKLHHAFPAAAQDYFFVNIHRLMIATVVVNALPFNRLANPRQSIQACRMLLENEGNILVIFPEGTRSPSGEMSEFKPGTGLMLAGTSYPVVPCYLEGTHQGWPKGKWFPRPSKIRLRIGTPLSFSHLEPGKTSALEIGRLLQQAVIDLRDSTSPPR